MKILTWSVGGIGSEVKISLTRRLVRRHKINFLFLQDALKSKPKEMDLSWEISSFGLCRMVEEADWVDFCWSFELAVDVESWSQEVSLGLFKDWFQAWSWEFQKFPIRWKRCMRWCGVVKRRIARPEWL
ncbi:hypothetical protein GQ457_14G003950 [Hibiscus cannabinus]